ncbi:class I SAM-dependent methyltransferase [bacterium]|nr:class I SAM-dependent methyltransferase [bacterium]
MADANTYWDKFYEENVFKNGKAPNSFLNQMLPRLQKGLTLDVAMGEGENSVYLAQKGFEVEGFDISDIAVTRAIGLAKDTGVEIAAKKADADMYLMNVMEYDTIIMLGYKPQTDRFFPEMIKALKQGGSILIEAFHTNEMDEALSKNQYYKNNYFKSNELLDHLRDLKILFYQEGDIDGKHKVQILAQKHVDRDAAKYDLFGMHTKAAEKKSSKQLDLAEALFKK